MQSSNLPPGSYPQDFLETLEQWANSPRAMMDLEAVFGAEIDMVAAYRFLDSLRSKNFSCLPTLTLLESSEMPGLAGGYSREMNRVYLSRDCVGEERVAVLMEEIGHYLDTLLCASETPGDEGAVFAAQVLGVSPAAWSEEDDRWPVCHEGRLILVEAARKSRGSSKSRRAFGGKSRGFGRAFGGGSSSTSSAPTAAPGNIVSGSNQVVYTFEKSVRIVQTQPGQRLIGSSGDDTFVLLDDSAKIEDPNGGVDTVETTFSHDISKYSIIENLALAGSGNINGTGNGKANLLLGNAGNNRLDGGVDFAVDTLIGGAGDDTYVLRDSLDKVVEVAGGGSDAIETTINKTSLAEIGVANIENLIFAGDGSATLFGNELANILVGGTSSDNIYGGQNDTLIGRQGDDAYFVQSQPVRVIESDGPVDGVDTIFAGIANYSMAAVANVEVLEYVGNSNTTLTGNQQSNTIYGALQVRNTIIGGIGSDSSDGDYLYGGDRSDSLYGGAGNDTLAVTRWADPVLTDVLGTTLRSGFGSDTLNGGAGDDWYIVNSQTAYTFQDTLGTNTIASTVDFSLRYNRDIGNYIQNLYLIGKSSLMGAGSDLANTITGNDGNNTISAEGGADYVRAGLGADYLGGGAGNDTLVGGGQPQTDIPKDASTPIDLSPGQSYRGKIEARQDSDWIRVSLTAGTKYYFRIIPELIGPDSVVKSSDVAFGVSSVNYYDYGSDLDVIGLVGDDTRSIQAVYDHSLLVLNADGSRAFGIVDKNDWRKPNNFGQSNNQTFESNNIRAFSFTAFDSGEFYIPVTGAGPAVGSYRLFVSENNNLLDPGFTDASLKSGSSFPEVLADNASDTLVGGLGADVLYAVSGRDSLGNYYGDTLIGGTNGIPGSVDTDNSNDTLIGAAGSDLLDGGVGNDSMTGGSGNDTYFVDSRLDTVFEDDRGGLADLAIFSISANRNFSQDLAGGLFQFNDANLDTLTGQGFDIDMARNYSNVEFANLVGSANLYLLGNKDANRVVGNFGNNLIVCSAGNDSLLGEGGNDYLIGGDGGDFLNGGSGVNTMDGGLGDDTYIVNDRNDRIINEISGIDGGQDRVLTYFNFDPIQGSALSQFQPNQPDNSPSSTKAPSFASADLTSFFNLENFELLGLASYGVGNALRNSILAGQASALLLGMGGEDYLAGGLGDDSLYGDTPDFYASPDLYAAAPVDTRTQAFVDGIVGQYGNDFLSGGLGSNFLDGGKGMDTMIGGAQSDTFVQDNVGDLIFASLGGEPGSGDELISSVNLNRVPDGISKLMFVVKEQERNASGVSITGQTQVGNYASFFGAKDGNQRFESVTVGGITAGIANANNMELMYGVSKAETFSNTGAPGTLSLSRGPMQVDPVDGTKVAYLLSWTAIDPGDHAELDPIIGYTVSYRVVGSDHWLTYVDGRSQDFQGTTASPSLLVRNLELGKNYEFKAQGRRRSASVVRDDKGNALSAQVVTLQGGIGSDLISSTRLIRGLPGGLLDDGYVDPALWNNPLDPLPIGFLFAPQPVDNSVNLTGGYATYLDGGFGNDILTGWAINNASGNDYTKQVKQWAADGVSSSFQNITFRGLHTLNGGQGSDTFIVRNGGRNFGDEFDWVIKYGNETPVDYGFGGIGESLNGGQHNLVISAVPYLTLSDQLVHQGKFIDQLALAGISQFGMGNALENYIYDGVVVPSAGNTLVGDKGRDSIVGNSSLDVLIGGTAYGLDNVGYAIKNFAPVAQGGDGQVTSIFRDTDPIPVEPNGPAAADPSQFWFVPGYYGSVYDLLKNSDTLVGNASSKAGLTLDGGAGFDSMVGSKMGDTFYVSSAYGDIIKGNGGGDSVIFTDSDTLWWAGWEEGALLPKNDYALDGPLSDFANLTLQMGSPTAREATGNNNANLIVGNEFDNELIGKGAPGGGIDILVGDGMVDVNGNDKFQDEGYLSSDFFYIDDTAPRYRDTGTWSPKIITTDISTEVEKTDPITGDKTKTKIPKFKHDLDVVKSVYLDDDFVVIADFETVTDTIDPLTGARTRGGGNPDSVFLKDDLSKYSIGNLPTDMTNDKLGKIGVGPNGKSFSGGSFGVYYTGDPSKWGEAGVPNLVAVIQSQNSLLLDTDGDGIFSRATDLVARKAFAASSDTSDSAVPDPLMGWGQFYELDSSNFAQYVNKYGGMSSSTASLSSLVNQIV